MKGHAFAVPILATLLLGCDTYYSVSRAAPLSTAPSSNCVEHSLRSIPEIHQVIHSKGTPGDPFDDQFCYKGESAHGTVEWIDRPEKTKSIRISSGWLNHVPSAQELMAAFSLMDRVYAALKNNCPQIPAATEFREMK